MLDQPDRSTWNWPAITERRTPTHVLAAQYGWCCFYCGLDMVPTDTPRGGRKNKIRFRRATRDHEIPLSRRGPRYNWNLIAACVMCNKMKGSLTAEEFFWAALVPSRSRKIGGSHIDRFNRIRQRILDNAWNADSVVGQPHEKSR